jgi:hypothetical protein
MNAIHVESAASIIAQGLQSQGDGLGYVQGACDGFEVAAETLDVIEQRVPRTEGEALCGDRGEEIMLELRWRRIQAKLQTFARRNRLGPSVDDGIDRALPDGDAAIGIGDG